MSISSETCSITATLATKDNPSSESLLSVVSVSSKISSLNAMLAAMDNPLSEALAEVLAVLVSRFVH